jgi:hypothetical protein
MAFLTPCLIRFYPGGSPRIVLDFAKSVFRSEKGVLEFQVNQEME